MKDPLNIESDSSKDQKLLHAEENSWLYWTTTRKERLADCKIFEVNKIFATSKSSPERTGNFYTLSCDAWVNVIAINDQKEVMMVEQFRHGIQALTLEIPGGIIESTDHDASAAALRELREETGCTAERCSFLGKNQPNPALQNNLCYTFLAEGTVQIEAPKFDNTGTEKINPRFIKLADIGPLIRNGTIAHALVIAAFHFLSLEKPELTQQL